ncbi:hypothetical protein BJ508DRAFT_311170 [Ascobolus immersus RN42]|uniref:Uncharacterized protein n=1 Tax=Ascobolus immersus RN42 TaxID=1160509 RepID=A0A3N4HR91_ASCIM|nr:hypothetical protein BJ508DRAFT_311170 [Ascobolus immersus RN42]
MPLLTKLWRFVGSLFECLCGKKSPLDTTGEAEDSPARPAHNAPVYQPADPDEISPLSPSSSPSDQEETLEEAMAKIDKRVKEEEAADKKRRRQTIVGLQDFSARLALERSLAANEGLAGAKKDGGLIVASDVEVAGESTPLMDTGASEKGAGSRITSLDGR